MFRRLINFATGASLLLTATICFLWWQSYARSDKVTWSSANDLTYLRAAPGRAVLYLYRANYPHHSRDARGLRFGRDAAAAPELEMMSVLFLCSNPSARLVQWEHAGFAWS